MNELAPIAVCVPLVGAALLVAIFARVSKLAVEIAATFTGLATLALCCVILASVAAHGASVMWFGGWHPGNTVGLGNAFVVDPAGAAVAACVAFVVTGAIVFSRQYFDRRRSDLLRAAARDARRDGRVRVCGRRVRSLRVLRSLQRRGLRDLRVSRRGEKRVRRVVAIRAREQRRGTLCARRHHRARRQHGRTESLAAIGRSLGAQHASAPLLAFAFAAIAAGLFARGALVPLHFWFDEVHANAPTPLCVVLSGAMVPLALFGFVRLYLVAFSTALPPAAGPSFVLCAAGLLSAAVGSLMCLRQLALKRMLAFATVAHAGVAAISLSAFTAPAFAGAALYFGGYAFAVAGSFMAVAVVRSVTKRNVDLFESAGAGRRFYLTATIFALGTCEVAGVWPSARAIVAGGSGAHALLVLAAFVLVAGATGGACVRAFYTVFVLDRARSTRGNVPWFMLVPAFAFVAVPLLAATPAVPAFVERAANDLLDVERYRAISLGATVVTRSPGFAPGGLPLAWLAALSAAAVAYLCIARARPVAAAPRVRGSQRRDARSRARARRRRRRVRRLARRRRDRGDGDRAREPAVNAVADGLWFLAAFGVAMLAVTPIFTRDAGTGRPSATLVAQLVLGILGAAVLGFHMFPIARKADEDFPVVDTITLGCIAIVGIAAILPRIRSLKIFGDNEIVIDEGKLAVSGYEKSVSSIAHLLERWASTIGTLYANVANAPSVSEVLQIERCFFRDRLGESKEFVAESDRSPVRMAVWLRNESDKLEFEFSNEITDDETTGASLGFEQGMIGQCFREQGTLNAAGRREPRELRFDRPRQGVSCRPRHADHGRRRQNSASSRWTRRMRRRSRIRPCSSRRPRPRCSRRARRSSRHALTNFALPGRMRRSDDDGRQEREERPIPAAGRRDRGTPRIVSEHERQERAGRIARRLRADPRPSPRTRAQGGVAPITS